MYCSYIKLHIHANTDRCLYTVYIGMDFISRNVYGFYIICWRLCIDMTSHRCRHNFTFMLVLNIENGVIIKSILVPAFCFVFIKRKVLLTHIELFIRRMVVKCYSH